MYQQIVSFWFEEVEAVELFRNNGIQSNLDFELSHKKIIEKFARYPHRNKILGRKSTAEEIAFLTQPGSSFSAWFP